MKRPRYTIRAILVLMLCVACFFGGWQARELKLKREQEAMRDYVPRTVTFMSKKVFVPLNPPLIVEQWTERVKKKKPRSENLNHK